MGLSSVRLSMARKGSDSKSSERQDRLLPEFMQIHPGLAKPFFSGLAAFVAGQTDKIKEPGDQSDKSDSQ